MIGQSFTRYLKERPPRYLPKLQLFVEFLKLKVEEGISRSSYINNNSYGLRLLSEIIKATDLSTLLIPNDPYNRLGYNLFDITRDLEKYIDVRNGKHTTKSLFVQSKNRCFELITPARRNNPLLDIPFDKDYNDPKWSTIRPLRIVDMSPCDLTFKVYNDQLDYYSRGPNYAVYSLDCFALVSKFVAYYKLKPMSDLDQCISNFLHYEIIVPTLLNDSVSLWLRNVYRQQFVTDSKLESMTSTIWDNVDIDTLGTEFSAAMIDVINLKRNLSSENIDPLTVLSSLPLSVTKQSSISYYNELYSTTLTPNQLPYVWVESLKNLAWFEFVILLMSFTPNIPEVVSAKRFIIRDVKLAIMCRPWSQINSSIPYKTTIKNKLEGMYNFLRETDVR
jgi:hypothetical protein